jgi:predicted TIM-barrel fold metal-dependent hydrolase
VIEAEARPEDNQWVFDLAKTEPMILGYIARLSPGQPDFAEHFETYCKDPVFRGLRLTESMLLGGLGHAAFEKDLQRMAEQQLTLDLIGGTALLPAGARLGRRLPGLQLVIDHLPFQNWDGHPEAMRSALRDIASLPNVYAKVSNVARRTGGQLVTEAEFYQPGLDALRELFGNDRILYGSNWPVSDLVAPYDQMFQIVTDYFQRQDPGVAEKFFWKNSQTSYRWVTRGEAGK